MPVIKGTKTAGPELTVLAHGPRSEAVVRDRKRFRLLRQPDQRSADHARNVFVLVAATELPHLAAFISTVNRRNQLRALVVREDVEPSSIPQMFDRAHLRMLRNTIIHSGDAVPRRLLTAWAHNAQDELIAKATVSEDRLFLLSCALRQYEVAFSEMAALKCIPKTERPNFVIAQDGGYIHWPGPDIHIDLDAIRVAIDPKARAKAVAEKARRDARYGAAIGRLRMAKGLKQSDIGGLSERQVRRIEKGEGTTVEALSRLAAAHGMDLDGYLSAVSENVCS